MTLQDPIEPNRIVCLNIEGTGLGQWAVKQHYTELELYTPCLALWAPNDHYYVAFVPDYLDIPTLAEEVFNGTRIKLPLHWIKKGMLPASDEATGLFGRCLHRPPPVPVLIR